MAVVWVPPQLQGLAGGAEKITVSGATLRQVINHLDQICPGMKEKLVDEAGRIQPGIAVAIDGETAHLGLLQPVQEDSEIHFIPAMGGG